jgi:triacylglycerol esterase/lipase EstA (alpha/beta hydrolase family)
LVAGSALFVLITYTHAFYHRRLTVPLADLVRAAFVEIGAILILLPFVPFSLFVGGSYRLPPDPDNKRPRRHPVILLHGFAMNRTNWVWFGRQLAKRGFGPLYGTSYLTLQPVQRSAKHLARFIEQVRAREQAERVDIVSHSLGGVVARYYIEKMGGSHTVGRLVTIGSPHRGTAIAHYGPLIPSAIESRAGSPLLLSLGQIAASEVRYTSIWSHCDAIIEPPESSSIVPVGEDRVFKDIGHLSLLLSRRVLDIVADRLAS